MSVSRTLGLSLLAALLCSSAEAKAFVPVQAPTILCADTGGTWDLCGSGCGPATCAASKPGPICPAVCIEQCECPSKTPLWDASLGCIAASACAPVADDPSVCAQTGGTWTDCGSGCGPATCDNPSPGPICPKVCVSLCQCGAGAPLWDATHGCISKDKDACGVVGVDADQDGFEAGEDCDDNNPAVNPKASEVCGDGLDNNCSGQIDEGCEPSTGPAEALCDGTGGAWTECGPGCGPTTCDTPQAKPGAPQICPDVCVAQCVCGKATPIWDSVEGCVAESTCGGPSGPQLLCGATGGFWSECGSGCGPETCAMPTRPDNCDAVCVEQCGCPGFAPLWSATDGCIAASACPDEEDDDDMDGFVEPEDCDDDNAAVNPEAAEVCNGMDDDCDGELDEGCEPAATEPALCEGSGGVWETCPAGCQSPTCQVPKDPGLCPPACFERCVCPAASPFWDAAKGCIGASECVGGVAVDGDGDGFFAPQDCDDNDAAVNPAALEICDGIDNDCTGGVDEGCEPPAGDQDAGGDPEVGGESDVPGQESDISGEASGGSNCAGGGPSGAPLWVIVTLGFSQLVRRRYRLG